MCVSGCASARPGIGSNAARVPVLTITLVPRRRRVAPPARVTSSCFRAYEASRPKNEFRARLLVVVKIDIVQIRYHASFSGEDCRHVNAEAVRETGRTPGLDENTTLPWHCEECSYSADRRCWGMIRLCTCAQSPQRSALDWQTSMRQPSILCRRRGLPHRRSGLKKLFPSR